MDGGRTMAISYNKLWKLLVDRHMSKCELRKITGISPNTMTKLSRDEPVTFFVLDRICDILNVDYGDVISYVPSVKRE